MVKFSKINVFLTILFATVILHICSTFSYSYFPNLSAYRRLSPLLKTNSMTLISQTTDEKQLLPFLSSDTHLAICHFDTSQHNVVITATLPEQGWSIVLYDTNGTTLYSDIANVYGSSQVDLYLVPDDDRFLGVSLETRIQSNSLNKVLLKADKGLAVVRALDAGYSYNNRVQDILKKARCTEDKRVL